MHIEDIIEAILQSIQNVVGICKQIFILIPYQVTSMLETLQKCICVCK